MQRRVNKVNPREFQPTSKTRSSVFFQARKQGAQGPPSKKAKARPGQASILSSKIKGRKWAPAARNANYFSALGRCAVESTY